MTNWAVAEPGRLSTGIRASPNPWSVRAILSYTSRNDVPVEEGGAAGRARATRARAAAPVMPKPASRRRRSGLRGMMFPPVGPRMAQTPAPTPSACLHRPRERHATLPALAGGCKKTFYIIVPSTPHATLSIVRQTGAPTRPITAPHLEAAGSARAEATEAEEEAARRPAWAMSLTRPALGPLTCGRAGR